MTPEQTHLWLEIQHRQMVALERIADSISAIAPVNTAAPNYQRPLETFTSFDWSTISATVERSDQYGAAIVSWRGLQFVRRCLRRRRQTASRYALASPSNKFGEAIWFSRCTGKDDNGENKYERLITFKAVSRVEVEPVPSKVQRLMQN